VPPRWIPTLLPCLDNGLTTDERTLHMSHGPGARAAFGWTSLTPSEHNVVQLVATGLSNPQVGERLFVSRRTVETHLKHVFTKLGMVSRVDVAGNVNLVTTVDGSNDAGWTVTLQSSL